MVDRVGSFCGYGVGYDPFGCILILLFLPLVSSFRRDSTCGACVGVCVFGIEVFLVFYSSVMMKTIR